MNDLHFFAPGIPRPKGSKQQFLAKNKAGHTYGVMREDSRGMGAWREVVAWSAKAAMVEIHHPGWPDRQPVALSLEFIFKRTKYPPANQYPPIDLDKLLRTVFDALTGVIYADDKQVVYVKMTKRYALSLDEGPGVHIKAGSIPAPTLE